MSEAKEKARGANRDPITKEPGAHPAGVGMGGAGGAAVGAGIGAAVGGPPGALVGGAIGAVAGGLAGKGAAEAVNPTVEDAYWRDNYKHRPYASKDSYDRWRPAYQHGWQSYGKNRGKKFEDVEPEMRRDWDKNPSSKDLSWDQARLASNDAYQRVETNDSKARQNK